MESKSLDYYKRFHLMVTAGICCGLYHPCEWLASADRDLSEFMLNSTEHQEFINLATKDLFNWVHMREAESQQEADQWVSNYYSKEVKA